MNTYHYFFLISAINMHKYMLMVAGYWHFKRLFETGSCGASSLRFSADSIKCYSQFCTHFSLWPSATCNLSNSYSLCGVVNYTVVFLCFWLHIASIFSSSLFRKRLMCLPIFGWFSLSFSITWPLLVDFLSVNSSGNQFHELEAIILVHLI